MHGIVRKQSPIPTEVLAPLKVDLTVAVQVVSVHANRESVEGLSQFIAGGAQRARHVAVTGAAAAVLGALAVFVPVHPDVPYRPRVLVNVKLLLAKA